MGYISIRVGKKCHQHTHLSTPLVTSPLALVLAPALALVGLAASVFQQRTVLALVLENHGHLARVLVHPGNLAQVLSPHEFRFAEHERAAVGRS